MTSTCKHCGGEISERYKTATTCWICAKAKKRIADPQKTRSGNFKRLMIDGIPHCIDCKAAIDSECKRKAGAPMRCEKCRTNRRSEKDIQAFAHSVVSKAIRLGLLEKPSLFSCVDCGKPAECYEHRDYSKPLDVVPVCRSCNAMRGPAVYISDKQKAA